MSKVLGAVVLVMCVTATTWASPIINVGSHDLLPNEANQIIQVYVTGSDLVAGFNLKAQIGTSATVTDQPVFQSISFTGGMWDVHPNTTMGGPESGSEQYAAASVVFNNISDSVAANGLVVTMRVNTTGFNSGNFALSFANTDYGQDSEFLAPDGSSVAASITNGTIHITPEPATVALLGLGGLALLRRKRNA